jgi:hypothetical protein
VKNRSLEKKLNNLVSIIFLSVPPERISIRDETGTERTSVVGPYSEGDMVKLKCEVYGGTTI